MGCFVSLLLSSVFIVYLSYVYFTCTLVSFRSTPPIQLFLICLLKAVGAQQILVAKLIGDYLGRKL